MKSLNVPDWVAGDMENLTGHTFQCDLRAYRHGMSEQIGLPHFPLFEGGTLSVDKLKLSKI